MWVSREENLTGLIPCQVLVKVVILQLVLFVLFIIDIVYCLTDSKILLYADDIKTYYGDENVLDCICLPKDLNFIEWCKNNKLLLSKL